MLLSIDGSSVPAAILSDLGAIFVSFELSKSTCSVTSLAPGSEKMSRHSVPGGDVAALLACFDGLRRTAKARTGELFPLLTIQEAGLFDGPGGERRRGRSASPLSGA